uniref:Protein kinase domain-containing protein n=1 Tax=Helicotheca tamesis TaxID=374047 RepID=A0A7S2E2M2_9STRA|mmetsp:Transcript_11448/g.15874  ORF Transcript_11448/g.15874 Transcript_11448/m.15874 type:complete len:549 (+) Transcript_11448:106-1752(+)|eukprot:CAMPEP_0185738940 /NCGR_PEP_ID=MMETSP1171-20130828/34211_1 /TAXON_ID=374046 /ORGANISM="Helicotheca tamensis, Strain CCMP826" /LENGTH=548 /DNA_ID=CAMNT_0028410337 /DNA_START=58 /DNA_END=1704 /DNA_ORIENTATION=+
MGCAGSKANYIPEANGDEKAYKERYVEDRVLGQGEFGVVKLVHDSEIPGEPLASKELKKGMQFKDNTLYTPMKPEILQQELQILRTLNGEHFNLKLSGVFESSSSIFMITEFCEGGEMMDYVAKTYSEGIRTEDASRIGFQVLDAIDHCVKHGIMHRDLKSENIMFREATPGSELRIIDYGSGSIDTAPSAGSEPVVHKTMAGTAFYIAPEVFLQNYTFKADVWSIGVVMYVLVAGYPADDLQKAYNRLHKSKRDLKTLPNMPQDLPDSYYEMLEDLLTYKQKKRKTAAEVKECEFIKFHQELEEEQKKSKGSSILSGRMSSLKRTSSIVISGSNDRHEAYLGFRKFEMAVTTLLATLLSPEEYMALLKAVEKKLEGPAVPDMAAITEEEEESEDTDDEEEKSKVVEEEKSKNRASIAIAEKKKLNVMMVNELKGVLSDLGHTEAIEKIETLKNADLYDTFSYHIKMLRQFSGGLGNGKQQNETNGTGAADNGGGRVARMTRTMSVMIPKRSAQSKSFLDDSNHSTSSAGSFGSAKPGKMKKMMSFKM